MSLTDERKKSILFESRMFDSDLRVEEKNCKFSREDYLRRTFYMKIKYLFDVFQEYDLAYQVAPIDKYHYR